MKNFEVTFLIHHSLFLVQYSPSLPDLDSNQDKQNQNLSYYHYTIGQLSSCELKWSAKVRRGMVLPKWNFEQSPVSSLQSPVCSLIFVKIGTKRKWKDITDSRFTIADCRFSVHDSRLTIHDCRFT